MSDSTVPITERTGQSHFRPQWLRTAIICTVLLGTGGLIANQMPVALWIVVPFLCLIGTLAAFLNAGLILSNEGMEWYALHPRWRYRKVPWGVVLDVRRGLFGFGNPIRLSVEAGRYEPWVWCSPQPGQKLDIAIWPNALTNGVALWEAIHHYRNSATHSVSTTHV